MKRRLRAGQSQHNALAADLAATRAALDEIRQRLDEVLHRVRHVDSRIHDVETEIERREMRDHQRLRSLSASTAALAEQLSNIDPPTPPEDTLVSVIMPTYQRADMIGEALASVSNQRYRRWECVIVDDGSTDGTNDVVKPWLDDPRVHYIEQDHRGVAAARNNGLRHCTGEIVAYLDTDNVFLPTYLARVVDAYLRHPAREWSVAAQVLDADWLGLAGVRDTFVNLDSMRRANFVDVNALAHRRDVLGGCDLFDESLLRLADWDLALRLAESTPPLRIPAAGSIYRSGHSGRISDTEPFGPYVQRVRDRHRKPPATGLRVLMAEWHFPQITETYVRTKIDGLRRLGAEVEVWAEEGHVAVPYETDVPVAHGPIAEVIERFEPHVVLTHWTNKAQEFRDLVADRTTLYAVQTHGFEFNPGTIASLLETPNVVVHTFPHFVDPSWADHPRVAVNVSAFDPELFPPAADKDRRLVVRTSAGLQSKDLATFLETAKRCPDHRFVLVVGHVLFGEEQTEAVIAERDALGSPCEILVDLPHADAAALVGKAGIYLHTHGTQSPMGMSISISEALATGCFVIARDLPGVAGYLGGTGAMYAGDTVEMRADRAAAHIHATEGWTDGQWRRQWKDSVDWAYQRYSCTEVVGDMLRAWKRAEPELPIVDG